MGGLGERASRPQRLGVPPNRHMKWPVDQSAFLSSLVRSPGETPADCGRDAPLCGSSLHVHGHRAQLGDDPDHVPALLIGALERAAEHLQFVFVLVSRDRESVGRLLG